MAGSDPAKAEIKVVMTNTRVLELWKQEVRTCHIEIRNIIL